MAGRGERLPASSVDGGVEREGIPYDEGYYRYRESTRDFRIEAELLYRLLRPQPGSRILEVGCGGGALLSFLEGKGHEVVGVDILEEAVRLARLAAPSSRVMRARAEELPFADASFDRVVSHHLVEHLEDLAAGLSEWRRVLRHGGLLAVCTPNRLYPSPRIFEDPGHVRVYDGKELRRAVEAAGLEVERCFTVFPHLLRDRVSVAVGVPLYRVFCNLPRFRERGRSLLLSARRG